jgi:predicted dehydrogenase
VYGIKRQRFEQKVKEYNQSKNIKAEVVTYKDYRAILDRKDIDAVIIATPDHWHGPMTIAAARAGKHVYCEKPLTWTVKETYEVRKAVKESNIVFQLGHQGRQNVSYLKAKEVIDQGILGKISLIEITTNRNDPNGAWVYPIHPDAAPGSIDWQQFIGPAPWHDFSLERFFRWRCWWDYSTGLSGDLLTHEYDAMNQVLGLGIPHSAVSSGGIYFFKDGRTVPDVLHTVFEYPELDLTLMYSATLASNRKRDATMELGSSMTIYADRGSTRYKEKLDAGIIDPDLPIFTFTPGLKNVDAITSPTEQYFAGRGLMYTYRGGKRVDTTYLHLRDWLQCIRNGGQPGCNIDEAFEEAMTAHMGTLAFKENRQVFWDPVNERII